MPRDSGLVLPTYAITSLPAECPSFPRPSDVTPQPDGQARCSDAASNEYRFERVCLPLSDGETCDDVNPMCAANSYDCGLDTRAHFVCGPLPAEFGECCYVLAGGCAVGRPFLVDEVARVARVVCAPGFAFDSRPAMEALAPLERAELASAWAREGLAEHASVASFSRFTLECLALGAPPDIVAGSVQAALEELSHARRCFGLASAYAGAPLGPGKLAIDGALDEPPDLARVAAAVAREGCIAETVSALLLAAARDAAVDPVVKGQLAVMIEEEHRHVVLAWRFVRWALETGGESVRRMVQGAFQRAGDHVGFGAVSPADASPSVLRAHGRLSISERRDVARAALRQVVGEAARVLFETSPATTAPSS